MAIKKRPEQLEPSAEEYRVMAAKLRQDIDNEHGALSEAADRLRNRVEEVKDLLPRMINPLDKGKYEVVPDKLILDRKSSGDIFYIELNEDSGDVIYNENTRGVNVGIHLNAAVKKYDVQKCIIELYNAMLKASITSVRTKTTINRRLKKADEIWKRN